MASTSPVPDGSFVVLWAGENPALHAALLEQLDSAGIPYADKSFGDDEVAPTADPLPIDWKPRFGFEVAVLSSDLAGARPILDGLLDREPEDVELPPADGAAALSASESQGTPNPEETPSVQIWSGNNDDRFRFLFDALRENDIPMRLEVAEACTAVLVPPSFESRAREIVREVTQAAPPE